MEANGHLAQENVLSKWVDMIAKYQMNSYRMIL